MRFAIVLATAALVGLGFSPSSKAAELSMSEAYNFAALPEIEAVGGASMLWRTDSGIDWTFSTTGLRPMTPHTIWVVVFNNPEYCIEGCNDEDLPPYNDEADLRVDTSVLWGGGLIVGEDGVANFAGTLTNGTSPGELGWGPGMISSKKAEIHLVVRQHTDVAPGEVGGQIATATGSGCPAPSPSPVSGSEVCPDVQFAVHIPPSIQTAAGQ